MISASAVIPDLILSSSLTIKLKTILYVDTPSIIVSAGSIDETIALNMSSSEYASSVILTSSPTDTFTISTSGINTSISYESSDITPTTEVPTCMNIPFFASCLVTIPFIGVVRIVVRICASINSFCATAEFTCDPPTEIASAVLPASLSISSFCACRRLFSAVLAVALAVFIALVLAIF